jgi:hypothetical protein
MNLKALPAALLAFGTMMSAAGQARADDVPTYTIEDVTACSKDAMRLCKDKLPDLDAIEGCMKAHYDDLNPKCQARFKR